MCKINIPVGVSDFEQIRKNEYYYVDKSGMIAEILSTESTLVTLITSCLLYTSDAADD